MFWSDPGYVENHERMSALVTKLKGKVGAITQGGGEKSVERHTSRSKQLLYPGFPFLQFSQPVVYRLYSKVSEKTQNNFAHSKVGSVGS